jgi:MOSC domain-containing protein YiiM
MNREQASIHLTTMSRDHYPLAHVADLEGAVADVRSSPRDVGTIELICKRPVNGARELVDAAELDLAVGLVGDNWSTKPSKRTPDGSPNPEQQLTLMNIRAVRALGDRAEWPLAGDNLFVDLDLSAANLPPGTRLALGAAVIEVTATPHTGCAKFTERFGSDATKWVNSTAGRELNLRGINARVIAGGRINRGDAIRKA